jgi:squalene-hopene/tetraprenyl-beta-curcumene cyclase
LEVFAAEEWPLYPTSTIARTFLSAATFRPISFGSVVQPVAHDKLSCVGLTPRKVRSSRLSHPQSYEEAIPMNKTMRRISSLAIVLVAGLIVGCARSKTEGDVTWNAKTAAAYLDQRAEWWMGWQGAARDHQTFCVSCHTAVPYALSRPVLRKALGEDAPSTNERKLLDNVRKRVRYWKDAGTFYNDQEHGASKTAQSRGTEAVLNALILASYDVQSGQLSDDALAAFDNMWALQQTTGNTAGSWAWLNFGLAPWEARDSQFYGATLAAVAIGTAPENYRSTPKIQNNLKLLRDYLHREYPAESLINRVTLLWASTKMTGLLNPDEQKSIVKEVLDKQEDDGGWSLAPLSRTWGGWTLRALARRWVRSDGTRYDMKSDGYATGLITFALQQVGIPHDNIQLQKGLSWLRRNQNKTEGLWTSSSLNRRRNPSSNIGHFMSDAATAYGALALSAADGL